MKEKAEKDIQSDIMDMLLTHPKVAWCYVTTTGTFKGLKGGAKYKIGIPGMPDIMGQLKNGKTFGIEVKKPGGKVTKDQEYFINLINHNGGLAFRADSISEVMYGLGEG